MKLKNYSAEQHGDHIDVELTFDEGNTSIKLCGCHNYNGNIGAFGNPAAILPVVRENLAKIHSSNEEVEVYRDTLDGSIDIFTPTGTLLFSMEAADVKGADWVTTYSSVER